MKSQKTPNGSMPKGHRSQTGRVPSGQNWSNLSEKINNIVLDYNENYRIHIVEPIVI